jgi:hypothetical protein
MSERRRGGALVFHANSRFVRDRDPNRCILALREKIGGAGSIPDASRAVRTWQQR